MVIKITVKKNHYPDSYGPATPCDISQENFSLTNHRRIRKSVANCDYYGDCKKRIFVGLAYH